MTLYSQTPLRHYDSPPSGVVTQVHIADIHFGAIDPKTEYNILFEQFIKPISQINFDILALDGDLFDKKFLASSTAVEYASRFVIDCIGLCTSKNATMVVLAGTKSHDADQLSMFYGYTLSPEVDFRIVESIRFEYIKGLKILCIPEEYGKPQQYYVDYLANVYDTVFMHGTILGSVYGANKYTLESPKAPVFSIDAFAGCKGPIIAGHVHKAACYESYMYYVSNPIRYRFGEEEEKGFAVVLQSPQGHYYKFIPIESFRYDTIDVRTIGTTDPNIVVEYLNNLQANGIDHVRLDFSKVNDPNMQAVVEKLYADSSTVSIKRYTDDNSSKKVLEEAAEEANKYAEMGFLVDSSLDGYSKFVQFVNFNEGKTIITVEQLKAILAGQDFNTIF